MAASRLSLRRGLFSRKSAALLQEVLGVPRVLLIYPGRPLTFRIPLLSVNDG